MDDKRSKSMIDADTPMRPRTRIEEIVGIINWEALREQKLVLLELIERASVEDSGALAGLLHLLDAIQDAAADDIDEKVVFGDLEQEAG